MKKVNILLFVILVFLFSCSTDPEDTFETTTTIHNDSKVTSITASYNASINELAVECYFKPGTYSINKDVFKDNNLELTGSPGPVFTYTSSFSNQYSYLTGGFNQNVNFKIYNYVYDAADSTTVSVKELLAEVNVYKR